MSGIMKVLLLLAAVVCISTAQMNQSGQNCLCQRTFNGTNGSDLKGIQIFPANIFCDRVEIVVTTGTGQRFCLNPEAKPVQVAVRRMLRSKRSAPKPSLSS